MTGLEIDCMCIFLLEGVIACDTKLSASIKLTPRHIHKKKRVSLSSVGLSGQTGNCRLDAGHLLLMWCLGRSSWGFFRGEFFSQVGRLLHFLTMLRERIVALLFPFYYAHKKLKT